MSSLKEIERWFGIKIPEDNLKGDSYQKTLQLIQGLLEDKEWGAIEGRIGSGKTSTAYQAISELGKLQHIEVVDTKIPDRKVIKTSHILNAFVRTLGLKYDGDGSARQKLDARMVQVERILMKMKAAGVTALLLIDEAQELADDTLNIIKRLRDVTFIHQAVLLPVLFLGQPGLISLIDRNTEVAKRVRRRNRFIFEPTRKELLKIMLYKTQGILSEQLGDRVLRDLNRKDFYDKTIYPTPLELVDYIEEAMENCYNLDDEKVLMYEHFNLPKNSNKPKKVKRQAPTIGADDAEQTAMNIEGRTAS